MGVEALVLVSCDGRDGEDRCGEDGGDPFLSIGQAVAALRRAGWSFPDERNAAGERLALCPACTARKRAQKKSVRTP